VVEYQSGVLGPARGAAPPAGTAAWLQLFTFSGMIRSLLPNGLLVPTLSALNTAYRESLREPITA
jgi:hypothetical protein